MIHWRNQVDRGHCVNIGKKSLRLSARTSGWRHNLMRPILSLLPLWHMDGYWISNVGNIDNIQYCDTWIQYWQQLLPIEATISPSYDLLSPILFPTHDQNLQRISLLCYVMAIQWFGGLEMLLWISSDLSTHICISQIWPFPIFDDQYSLNCNNEDFPFDREFHGHMLPIWSFEITLRHHFNLNAVSRYLEYRN